MANDRQPDGVNNQQRASGSPSLRAGEDGADLAAPRNQTQVTIEAQSVEAIARRVLELLRTEVEERPNRLVDAATLARELDVERDWVYSHAEDLGAIRLGGPSGRLRFDREVVRERLSEEEPQRLSRRRGAQARSAKRKRLPRGGGIKLPQKQRRASGRTPARSPRQHQPGGNPDDEA